MPLNKLENFIKNTEGRILYVNPNDLDATDAIENQGNSLTKPFKTIQRALLESARFSYVAGNNNDLIEKTTILLFPGEHIVDNRPGFGIKDNSGAKAVSPAGTETDAQTTLTLTSNSNFDLTQENNILYRFNSINGGVVVPRGTSIVGLDLRKTKIRPKYVPNPTDGVVAGSAIFRVTGTCYFWQFSIFDGDENTVVYTDPVDFSANNRSKPTFSHHKLTCFEYVDGVNIPSGFALTDLEQYYAKLSNAFNVASGRDISNKWPTSEEGFAPQLPEYQIVGAFATDPINITDIISGDGTTPTSVVTVTTSTNHNLSVGTPISISGSNVVNYNVSAKVTNVISATQFTYSLPFVPPTLNANPGLSNAKVTVETDSVSGASPYIFNISMRSVWGMNGMHADGSKASGFRSMVVAQFTAVSLQKDDRAFVLYNSSSRSYQSINVTKVTGASLSSGSSSTTSGTVYHLNPEASYRPGWESRHIKASNDAIIQIVSVFAIGFANHFVTESGGDFSVTNSNSNFGQLSLVADGFKKKAFDRDNKAFITSVITPKAITSTVEEVEWVGIDTNTTNTVGISSHLYLLGFSDIENKPSSLIQGYKVGAKVSDQLFIRKGSTEYTASVYMTDNVIAGTAQTATGTNSSFKSFDVSGNIGANGTITLSATHNFNTGEKVILIEDNGDLPEKIEEHQVYYVIDTGATTIQLASSKTNAENGTEITGIYYTGNSLHIISRVSDKESGDVGSPVQFDEVQGQWFIHTDTNSNIYQNLASLTSDDIFFIKRTEDRRGLDEKLYKFRLVIPKEFEDTKDPEEGFVIQESSSTGANADGDFTLSTLVNYPSAAAPNPYQFEKNPSFISTCSVASNTVTVISELPHNLNVTETNAVGAANSGYNGTFDITAISDDKTFQYSTTDVDGIVRSPGNFTNNTSNRTTALPRFERNDWKGNYYIYRSEVIVPHEEGVQDGVYHLYVLAADYASPEQFTSQFFSQNVRDFYPQMDRDNIDDNPAASSTFARRNPVGDVVTSDLKKSITRESADKILRDFFIGLPISSVDNSTAGVSTITFNRNHNLSGIVTYSALAGGSGYTNGTYYNVKLLNNGTSVWDGATAKVVVSGGAVTSAEIIAGGSGYTDAEELDFDTAVIGGGTGAGVTVSTSGISTVIGNTLQITGIGTTAGGHFRITGVGATNQISIARTAGDPLTVSGQYAINIGPEISIHTTDNTTGFTTFTTVNPHGLVVGNKINILDNSNNNLGDFLVS
ncbi:MAG: tail fiber domain-containing protein, partial [Candidatus Kariarchaeaceae archaeon]